MRTNNFKQKLIINKGKKKKSKGIGGETWRA